jgi:hypothetical protein
MAIRGIANREKHKEDEKNKSPSERSLDLASGDNFKDKSVPQDEKTNHNSNDAATIPEVFDSSKYDSMTEMKESADMNEGGHLKEVLSSLEKEEPIEPTTADTRLSKMNINSPSAAASVTADASPPNLEERAATLRSSRDEQIVDRNLEDSKEKSQEEEIAVKDKAYSGQHLSSNIADPYTIFWRDVAKSWNDFYLEYARSVSDNSILVRFIFKILVV